MPTKTEMKKLLDLAVAEFSDPEVKKPKLSMKQGLERIDVTVKKLNTGAAAAGGATARIPLSSLCTSACFSSVSSVMVDRASLATMDADKAEAFVRLHENALNVLGPAGVAKAAKKHQP